MPPRSSQETMKEYFIAMKIRQVSASREPPRLDKKGLVYRSHHKLKGKDELIIISNEQWAKENRIIERPTYSLENKCTCIRRNDEGTTTVKFANLSSQSISKYLLPTNSSPTS